ncbi:KIF-binding protein [Teleopsis dalmanni]|uniref:KIF-binding protein n=1 Tax=Teleopsis dalmanni TaxID=139649 RepID=UPI0018CD985B|nr:KIF-binding protein [Teleopsis dalmanni]
MIPKEILSDLKELFEKANKLTSEEYKNDPPDEPYTSHYAARECYSQLQRDLDNLIASVQAEGGEGDAEEFIYKVLLAHNIRSLAQICVFVEEPNGAEGLLMTVVEMLEEKHTTSEAIIPFVGALTDLATITANRRDFQYAFEQLKRAEDTYKAFKESGKNAYSLSDVLGTPDETEPDKGNEDLENLYTHCTFFMAQVYAHMSQMEKSAFYCNTTLRRQITSKNLDHIDWALNAATLSQCYIGHNAFKAARHQLSAATYVIKEYEKKMLTDEMTEEQRNETTENYKHRYADIARCWAKYGINLLCASKDRLEQDSMEVVSDDLKKLSNDPQNYQYSSLKLDEYEKLITANYCLTFEDAKPIYHFVIKWLDRAKDYYKIDGEATEYAKIIIDYADLYLYVSFFEEDPINQSKMLKRRATYFEELSAVLNPTFYLAICRECWFGAGLTYSKILDIKLDSMENTETATLEAQKANKICLKAIKHFETYVKSYALADGVTMKPNLDVDDERNVLMTYMYLGRLYYKIISTEVPGQLLSSNNSLKYYKLFIEECAKHTEAANTLKAEIGVSREMYQLLPLRISTLRARLAESQQAN